MNALRSRLSYGNVMATIALFIALGGTGYAALQLPKASVGAKHLKKGSVTAKKIKRGAVTSTAVKDGSLKSGDFGAGQVPAGPKGDKGDKGDAGLPGSARAYTYLDAATCGSPGACVLDATESKGFIGARRTDVGIYCIAISPDAGIVRDGAAVLTTIDWSGTSDPEGNASALAQETNSDCDANEVRIRTQRFDITDHTEAVEANNISFFVAIP